MSTFTVESISDYMFGTEFAIYEGEGPESDDYDRKGPVLLCRDRAVLLNTVEMLRKKGLTVIVPESLNLY